MNLFDLIAMLLIAVGLVVGFVCAVDHGAWAALMRALSGAAKGFIVYVVFMFLILVVLRIGLTYRPPFPRCRSGRCTTEHYTYLSLDAETTQERITTGKGDMLARCRCGTHYLRRLDDRRVWEVASDGSLVPYMRYKPFGRWRPDPEVTPRAFP